MSNQVKSIRSFFWHAFYLSFTILLVWFWANNPVLNNYNLQLTAFFVISYFLGRFFFAAKNESLIYDILIFTAILLLILSSTGGLASPLFFLVYFLLFAIALLFDPPTTLTFALALALYFANSLTSASAGMQLLSLIFIAPLAIYFGKQYLKLLEANEKIKILAQKNRLQTSVSNELSENIGEEESSSLLWLTLNFKDGLLKIIHLSADLLSEIGKLSITQKERLQSIHDSAKEILKSGEKLKEKIDRETDEQY